MPTLKTTCSNCRRAEPVCSGRTELAGQDVPVDAVEVDATAGVVLEDGVHGHPRPALVGFGQPEAERCQGEDGPPEVGLVVVDHDVEVVVGAGLASHQGVHAPASRHHEGHASGFEGAHHPRYVLERHGTAEPVPEGPRTERMVEDSGDDATIRLTHPAGIHGTAVARDETVDGPACFMPGASDCP